MEARADAFVSFAAHAARTTCVRRGALSELLFLHGTRAPFGVADYPQQRRTKGRTKRAPRSDGSDGRAKRREISADNTHPGLLCRVFF